MFALRGGNKQEGRPQGFKTTGLGVGWIVGSVCEVCVKCVRGEVGVRASSFN